jgi:hypothetical protein
MKSTKVLLHFVAMSLLLTGSLAQAATITGTVTNKTTGKPAAGDVVVLVDPMSGMSEVAHATTDARGHYSLQKTGNGPALLRAKHQGAEYFIAAPEGGAAGNISVYDVAAKVDGVGIDEDVVGLVDTANGQLRVVERYALHNSSMPPRTQWSERSFEIVLPESAVLEGASAQRPGVSSLPTTVKLDPDGPKGHYSINFPIQPDEGEKGTLFQIEYELPYSGKFTFHPQVTLPAKTVWAMMPKSMTFTPCAGSNFQSSPQDPGFLTYVARNAAPGQTLEFTVSGQGALPREDQSGQQATGGQDAGAASGQPGGGMANPLGTPDPLSKYKWWIITALALLLVTAAAFLLRKPAPLTGAAFENVAAKAATIPAAKSLTLLDVIKEELFALETEKISGTISAKEYAELKAALDLVLKRTLKRQGTGNRE